VAAALLVEYEPLPTKLALTRKTEGQESPLCPLYLLSHDTVPYFYSTFWQEEKRESDWWLFKEDPWTLMLAEVAPRLNEGGITNRVISKILIDNPKRVLAF